MTHGGDDDYDDDGVVMDGGGDDNRFKAHPGTLNLRRRQPPSRMGPRHQRPDPSN